MSRSKHQQMRDAINDVELALNGLQINSVVRLFEAADDSVMVKLPLGALRQLARCYPALNRIMNDPGFGPVPRPNSTPDIEVACGKCGWRGKQSELGGKFTVGGCLYCPDCRANFQPIAVASQDRTQND